MLDSPAGPIEATADDRRADGTTAPCVVGRVSQRAVVCVRGRAAGQDRRPDALLVDVAFGGAFYAIVDAEAAGLAVDATEAARTASRRDGGQDAKSNGCGRLCIRSIAA